MGTSDADSGTGGGQPKGLQDVFQGGGTGGYDFGVGDVGVEPPHGTGPGKFSTQGCTADNWDISEEMGVWGLVIPAAGNINGGCRI